MSDLVFSKISSATFADFKSLLCSGATSGQCFCLNHRVEPKDFEIEEMAAAKMKSLVERRQVNGLLAYEGANAIAWVGVEPMTALVGHDAFEPVLEKLGSESIGGSVWAIHCIYIHPDLRGRGLSKRLIEEAIRYAEGRGAEKIWAFPSPELIGRELPEDQRFAGALAIYQELGFQEVTALTTSYLLLERKAQGGGRPRLQRV